MTAAGGRRGSRTIAAIGRGLYRTLLLAWPRDFRDANGRDAAEVFGDACADSWTNGGLVALIRRLGRAVVDVPWAGLAERIGDAPRPRLFGSLGSDVRHALRACRQRPGLSLAIVITLSLGIGANTAIFSVVDATLLRPLPYADAARVVYLRTHRDGAKSTGNPTAEEFAQFAPRLQSYSRIEARSWQSVLLTGGNSATRARYLAVSAGYLDALGTRPIAGRLLRPDDALPGATAVVVLSDRLVTRRYGAGAAVVGTTIAIDDINHVVVGVVPQIESDTPGLRFELYGPLPLSGPAAKATGVVAIAWLKPAVSIDAARAEFQSLGDVVSPSNLFWKVRELRDPQLALLAAVFLLLLIACVNVANLLLASGQARRAEMAVRVALGAARMRIVRLLLIESALLALAGGAGGVLIARGAIALFTALEPAQQLLTRLESIEIDGVVLGYAIAIALLTSVVFGLVPALRGSATPPQAALREGDQRTGSRLRRLPGAFIAVEVALSVVLLIAAGLVGRAFFQARFADPGFAADRVLTVRIALPEARYATADRRAQFFDELLARARQLPGVTAATIGYGATTPPDFVTQGALQIDGSASEYTISWLSVSMVQPGYFAVMGIPLLAGRELERHDLSADPSSNETPIVINRSMAKSFWSGRDPVGATFRLAEPRGPRRYRVIGVAGDVRDGLSLPACDPCGPQIYRPLPAERQYTDVLVRVADRAPLPVAGLRDAVAAIDPGVPADDSLQSGAASVYSTMSRQRFNAALFGTFAAVALALVGLGISAVIAHSVSQRTREMGIRLALGARPAQVRRLVIAQGVRPAIAGLALGIGFTFVVTRTMTKFLYGVSPTDPLTIAAMSAVLIGVSLAAIAVPALRATRVDPAKTLRD